jgi:hypothetical protein
VVEIDNDKAAILLESHAEEFQVTVSSILMLRRYYVVDADAVVTVLVSLSRRKDQKTDIYE